MEGQASNPDLLELQNPVQTVDQDDRFSMQSLDCEVDEEIHVHPLSDTKSTLYLLTLTIGLGGLQVLFSVLFAHGISHLSSLGVSRSQAAATFASGPICGIFIQPCFGLWSDHCNSAWGKRRPFIAGGAISLIAVVLGLAWTQEISRFMFLSERVLAILFMICVFIAIQPIQGGTRALIADSCPAHQQAEANAWASRITSVASVLGYMSAFIELHKYSTSSSNSQFKYLAVVVSTGLAFSTAITCVFVTEEVYRPLGRDITDEKFSFDSFFSMREFARNVRESVPKQVMYIYIIQLMAWMGWYPYLLYASTYVADIYRVENLGVVHENLQGTLLFDTATRIGALGPLISSIVALLTATALPLLRKSTYAPSRWLNMRSIWLASHALTSLCLFTTIFVSSVNGTIIIFGFLGISWAVTSWVPYTLLSIEVSKPSATEHGYMPTASAGIIFGLHNIGTYLIPLEYIHAYYGTTMLIGGLLLAICIPQVLISLGSSVLWKSEDADGIRDPSKIGWILRVGCVTALFALWMTTRIQDLEPAQEPLYRVVKQSMSLIESREKRDSVCVSSLKRLYHKDEQWL